MAATASRLTDREHLPYKVDVQQPTPRHCSPSCGNSVHDRWNTQALTNVSKHAAAHVVLIKLELDNERIRLSIADDGLGFSAQAPMHGETARWGLAIMQARAAAVGGELHIRTTPGAGTVVEFAISEGKWA
jgi:nitrate/nitrite-specific signal transduction histidine kinase